MKNKNAKSEKCSVANSNVEGGFIKKRKKAFTLIELLAIIVILAIIAVITVPIILNIIENSRKGAATDSAYGYKDSVNKWYVSELSNPNNQNFNLSSSYTVEDGKIINDFVQNDTGTLIPFSGDKPSSGELHYTNNVLVGGCLVFGDYKITFKSDGSVDQTVKGDCSDYQFDDGNVPSIDNCEDCLFVYTTSELTIGTSIIPANAANDYRKLTSNHFLGLIANPSTGVIERAFVCGIEGTVPFCLEGYDASKWGEVNTGILNTIFSTEYTADDEDGYGNGTDVSVYASDSGQVNVASTGGGHCFIGNAERYDIVKCS